MTSEPDKPATYGSYIKSVAWSTQRHIAARKWGRKCTCCESSARITWHHVFYRNLFDCIANDLMPLCWPCHWVLHEVGLPYRTDIEGDYVEKRRLTVDAILRAPPQLRKDCPLAPESSLGSKKVDRHGMSDFNPRGVGDKILSRMGVIDELAKRTGRNSCEFYGINKRLVREMLAWPNRSIDAYMRKAVGPNIKWQRLPQTMGMT